MSTVMIQAIDFFFFFFSAGAGTKAEGKHLNNYKVTVLIFKLGTKAEVKQ